MVGALVGASIGALGAMVIDHVFLAYETPREREPKNVALSPWVNPTGFGATLSLGL